ncbi:MAG: DUF4177 domain-containing protein [Anaerolineae bacterium]
MQKWEYKIVNRHRGFPGGVAVEATDWNVDILKMLPSLGNEGWELVAIEPRSDYNGNAYAGCVTSDIWVFKRPIPT